MRTAKVYIEEKLAGKLCEEEKGKKYTFTYEEGYSGLPISLTMPIGERRYEFSSFPPFFDGLLPEGIQLEGLLNQHKMDRDDLFSQLVAVGSDLVGAVRVEG